MNAAADLLLFLSDTKDSCFSALQFFHRGGDGTETLDVFVRVAICRFRQKHIELFAQLCDRSVNVSEAHALTGDRSQFLLHRIHELIRQHLAPRHGRVDGCQHRLLERQFVQRRRFFAVFLAIIQSAAAAPYGTLLAVLRPHHSAVCRAALTAEQQTTERVLAAVAAHTCGSALFRAAGLGPTPRQLHLHSIEPFSRDDGLVVVLNQIHGKLSGISDDLLADAVPNEGLLEQDITAVFFIREDRPQVGGHPFRSSCRILKASCFQGFLDIAQRLTG